MQKRVSRALLRRAGASLALTMAGAGIFALTAPGSWLACGALLASLCGLALLYDAVRSWRRQMAAQSAGPVPSRAAPAWLFPALRITNVVIAFAAAAAWLWAAGSDLNEMRLILSAPRYTAAQVIGRELMPRRSTFGYVHYAYRVTGSLAPESRFAVPLADYDRYRAGRSFDVTYAGGAPPVHRMGRIGWEYGLRRFVTWLLLLANGAGYLLLPLWALKPRYN